MRARPKARAGIGVRRRAGAALAAAVACACAVGPDYERPALDVPADYKAAASAAPPASGPAFADLGWWEVFEDPQLAAYLEEALANSFDLKIAAARVLQAAAGARIARSEFFPTINAGGDLQTARVSERGPTPLAPGVDPEYEFGTAFIAMPAYEIDLWGRIRRANEAAWATLLATEADRQTVRQTLVALVATTYLELLELDHELEIALRTLDTRQDSLQLTIEREAGGVAALQDVRQAEILVHTAEAAVAEIHRAIELTENALCVLLGRNPGPLPRGPGFTTQTPRAEVPAGLPSSLLGRRPDIRAAEQRLVAANADIGQAKAAFFPELTLTGFFGYQTTALSDLFSAPARTWQFGPAVTLPLFTGGRLTANLELAQARFDEALASYRQVVQVSFREVADGLVAWQRNREVRDRQEARTLAHRGATELAGIRYEGGVTSYLEVLYNEQELFNAELELARARLAELVSVVQLYRALGGGWQPREPDADS